MTWSGGEYECPQCNWKFDLHFEAIGKGKPCPVVHETGEECLPCNRKSKDAESFSAEGGCVHHNYPMAGTPDLSFDNDGSVWYEIVCGNCGATAEGAFYPEEWGEELYAWNEAESTDFSQKSESFSAEETISIDTLNELLRKVNHPSHIIQARWGNPRYVVIDTHPQSMLFIHFAMNLQEAREVWKEMGGGIYANENVRVYKLPLEYTYPYLAAESFSTDFSQKSESFSTDTLTKVGWGAAILIGAGLIYTQMRK